MKTPEWVLSLLLASVGLTQAALANPVTVSGFSMPEDAIAFHNYSIWGGSLLPEGAQLPHCTTMALFARQMFLHALFVPALPKLPPEVYQPLLQEIFSRSTTRGPSDMGERMAIPGYASLYELSADEAIQPIIKNVLGDSITDALRYNWNWGPLDAALASASSWVRKRQEKKLRDMIDRDRPAMVYLTDGTATAHAVLLYSYDDRDDRVVYEAYDSNHMETPVELTFWKSTAKMEHPDRGMRDPWVLHPY